MRSDFEKLVIARKYIAALEQENEALRKEIEEQHLAQKDLENSLKEERDRKEKMSPEEKLKIKSDLYVQQMKDSVKNLHKKLKQASEERDRLKEQVIRLKREQDQ